MLSVITILFFGCSSGTETAPPPCGSLCGSWQECSNDICISLPGYCDTIADCISGDQCNTTAHICYNPIDPCDGIDCSLHGTCTDLLGTPSCNCIAGYQDNDLNLTCDIDCTSVQQCGPLALGCDDSSGIPICNCDVSYFQDTNYRCITPCEPDYCTGGTCVADSTTEFHCDCPTGMFPSGQYCLAAPISIVTGMAHSCALLGDNTVACWGNNTFGQLGAETTTENSTDPVQVTDLIDVAMLVAGSYHTCALLTDYQTVKCWGKNDFGQLGNNTLVNSTIPVTVQNITRQIQQMSGGSFHTCILLEPDPTDSQIESNVHCWGYNLYGQLGNMKIENSKTPTPIARKDPADMEDIAIAIASGDLHNCVLLQDDRVKCWGFNGFGQLGIDQNWEDYAPCKKSSCNGATERRYVLLPNPEADDFPQTPYTGVTTLYAGYGHTCVAKGTDYYCFGRNEDGELGNETQGIPFNLKTVPLNPQHSGYSSLSLGGKSSCGLLGDTLWCWGLNSSGQLGITPLNNTPTPTETSITPISTYQLGQKGHGCAVTTDHGATCWGYNNAGQLGTTTTEESNPTPVMVDTLSW